MTPFNLIPKCELCDTLKNTVCISKEHRLYLCENCYEKMSVHWRDNSGDKK